MNQDKVTVKMNFCINPVRAEHIHIGGEFSIKDGQTQEQAWAEHIGRMEAFYKENFPNAVPVTIPEVQINKEPEPKLTKEEKQKKLITDTTTIDGPDGLLSFRLLVKNNPHLQETYDKQMELLTNKKD